ncbi:MAG: tRNA (guanosine(46)-N7)-methyltransferase TrmB [Parvibaculaceae bacterium]
MTERSARRQLYGRRKGKALRPHHKRLIADMLPRLRFAPGDLIGGDVRLEIGFGGGEHLAHQAGLHPQTLFIGAEPFINGVAKLLALIEEKGLSNIRIHDGDARDLLDTLPDASLSHIYILYPDPWPKARHQRRRVVNRETVPQMHRVLKPGGHVFFASDIPAYIAWTLYEMRSHGGFRWLAEDRRDWTAPFPDWIETRYEAKAKREERVSRYLRFAKA